MRGKPSLLFGLEAHADAELDEASHAFGHEVDSPMSCAETFDYLSEIASDADWFPDFVDGAWTTPAPHGVGSERWFKSDILWLQERFVAWEPGRRFAFVGTQTTLPLMARFGEEYRFVPSSAGGCRVHWRILYTPRAVFRPLHPFVRPYFARTFRAAARSMAVALEHRADRARVSVA